MDGDLVIVGGDNVVDKSGTWYSKRDIATDKSWDIVIDES